MAYRITGVSIGGVKYSSSSTVSRANSRIYKAVLGEFVDSAKSKWFTVRPESLVLTIPRHKVFVASLSSVPRQEMMSLDAAARGLSTYLGAIEIDPGNPLLMRLLVRDLPEDYFYLDGALAVYTDLGYDPEDLWDLSGHGHWWSSMPFSRVFWWSAFSGPQEPFEGSAPPPFKAGPLSDRGRSTKELLAKIESPRHVERVLTELHAGIPSRPASENAPTSITLDFDWEADLEAVVEALRDKFTGYLLSETHQDGKHKARVFRAALGFTSENWRLMARQVVAALATAAPKEVRSSQHAVQYSFEVLVVGPNGREAPVLTAWKLLENGMPFLVTAYVVGEGDVKDTSVERVRSFVVPRREGQDYWQTLHETADEAGLRAMENHVPAPMFVVGDESDPTEADVVPGGEFGWAYVNVPDARRGFARFLVRSGLGYRGYRGGGEIRAPGYQVQAARAYAEAYALVLRLNGIECRVSSRLD